MSSNSDIPAGKVSDAEDNHWVDHSLIAPLRPYARLARFERPIGWWLLLLPGWWAIALAQITVGAGLVSIKLLTLFLIGAIAMRGAGCTFNDIVDRDFDGKVERTRSRPIPSGQVSVLQALIFLIALSLVGLVVLLQLSDMAIFLGIASLGLVAIYPFMKRFTYWPQVFLGLAFNWSALVGWAAVTGEVSASAWLLWFGGILWTLGYDTIYAHQDKEDDVRIGVKSTALKLGDATGKWLIGFFGGALVLIDAAGWLAGAGVLFHVGVAAAAMHAVWQLTVLDINDPDNCLKLFRANRNFGLIIFAGAALDGLAQGFL
ncbi:MAG TPA: 4-hydroxybenzoate octaprenyltransferase [Rhizobiales bacterium]|nr:4-hydroxybenzoate octaprenyltransferase [Hyphomicrobiales bacterium]